MPLSSRIFGFFTIEAFMVKARGDSMESKIASGDLVIAQRSSTANDRDIVVCVYKEMAMIKVYHKSEGQIFL